MPLYDFRCGQCGEFEAWRTLAELDQPMACPSCATRAVRLFSAPNISLSSGKLRALDRQEAPRVVQRESRQPPAPRHQQANGSRPWMVSHARAIDI